MYDCARLITEIMSSSYLASYHRFMIKGIIFRVKSYDISTFIETL